MININESIYQALAQQLLKEIGSGNYFNGRIEYDTEEFYATLRTTLIVYREPLDDPADTSRSATRITEIVPVWWEFDTVQAVGSVPNDFSWREFREYLL